MTTTWMMILLIASCAFVTWLPRILPFVLVKKMTMPEVLLKWLRFIPVCILSALVVDAMLKKQSSLVTIDWIQLLAFIPTILVAIWTKSLAKTVLVGVIAMALIRSITM